MFRVIIAGSRDFQDYPLLVSTMDRLLANVKEDVVVVCGKARGADSLGEQYARERGYQILEYPADWKTYGKAAGCIRNEEMAKNADALVAFWDGKSCGTENMIQLGYRYKLKVRVKIYRTEGGADEYPQGI